MKEKITNGLSELGRMLMLIAAFPFILIFVNVMACFSITYELSTEFYQILTGTRR